MPQRVMVNRHRNYIRAGRLLVAGRWWLARCGKPIFEIRDAEEGGFYARALGHAIFTEGDTWEDLRANVLEAVALHFEDGQVRPRLVQMHYVKDELIPLEAA